MGKRFILTSSALAGAASVLTPVIAYAEDPEKVRFSDNVSLVLTSPPSNIILLIVAIGGVVGIIAIGLASAYRRNREKSRHRYPPNVPGTGVP